MNESKLVEHLRVLTNEEFIDFLRFVKAMTEYEKDLPEEAVALIKYLLKVIPEGNINSLQKEAIYKIIYPKQDWKNGRIEKLMSAVLKTLKNYIQFKLEPAAKSAVEELLTLSAFYRKRKLHNLFELNTKQLKKYEDEITQPTIQNYLEQFNIANEIYEYQSEFNTRKEDLNLPETIFTLDTFYLAKKLNLILVILVQNQNTPLEIKNDILNTIPNIFILASEKIHQENLVIQIYIKAIQLQLEKEGLDDIFETFNTLLENAFEKIEDSKFALFCTIARIYSSEQYNKGRSHFLRITFNLFKRHLSLGVLYINGKIRAATMQNIIVGALKLKEYGFAKDFLTEHQYKIAGTHQPELVWAYNMAFYYFETGDFAKAQATLPNHLDLHDFYYILSARRLEIKIHFEIENDSKYDVVGNKIDAFKNFLFMHKKNQKISELIFNINNDFLDMIKQIRNTLKKDRERVESLLQKLEENKAYAEREWLLEKLEQLNSHTSNSIF